VSDKTQWELNRLNERTDKHEKRLDQHDEKLSSFQSFKDSTVEKLITIFKSIDEMKAESKWMKKTFTNTLLGAIVTVVTSIIIWLIQS
jgi:uncharacterized coiled-coil DUF342 family protein